jgi:tRNA(Ile2) C34 agmatinyltransferase TiaS
VNISEIAAETCDDAAIERIEHAWCGVCGAELDLVRPGKYQCVWCERREAAEHDLAAAIAVNREVIAERDEAVRSMSKVDTERISLLHAVERLELEVEIQNAEIERTNKAVWQERTELERLKRIETAAMYSVQPNHGLGRLRAALAVQGQESKP